ncbi:muconolactone Delta-isomerase [Brevibacterium daeguense]|uniref:Muconolactone Delta-isomerase n=1 Tax=Brevibacterium daeguense TaxID=909936 RepID=A0ABP8ELQ2_9MICO|nr:muconolactone Delta-isomerase [Brevibacterium daeguense]
MLYMTRMDVAFPPHLSAAQIADFQAREKEYSGNLQREGTIVGIWRIVGEYANHCLFDVPDNDTLHEVLSGFPMFPYMKIKVTPLAKHPNSIS